MRKDKPTMAIDLRSFVPTSYVGLPAPKSMALFASAGLPTIASGTSDDAAGRVPGINSWLPDPTKPFVPIVSFEGMPTDLVLPLGNCTDPAKCDGRCHYCLTRKYGADYWQRGVTS